jgi:hypothetical protein
MIFRYYIDKAPHNVVLTRYNFKKMVEEGYSPEQLFKVDETGPSSTARSLHFWPPVNTIS